LGAGSKSLQLFNNKFILIYPQIDFYSCINDDNNVGILVGIILYDNVNNIMMQFNILKILYINKN